MTFSRRLARRWPMCVKISFSSTARSQLLPKLHIRGEPPEGKPFDIECIYQFTFTGDSTDYRFKSMIDFVDSRAFAAMG